MATVDIASPNPTVFCGDLQTNTGDRNKSKLSSFHTKTRENNKF
jgi:hypothetical protein